MRQDILPVMVVGALTGIALLSVIGIAVLDFRGKPLNAQLLGIASTCVGALSSFLVQGVRRNGEGK